MPSYARYFVLFLGLCTAATVATYFGLVQQSKSPSADEWMFEQIGDIENPTAGIVLLIPSFMVGFTAMWAMMFAMVVGLLITPWELHCDKRRRTLAVLSMLVVAYVTLEALHTLWGAVTFARWGFILLSLSNIIWLIAIGCGVALVIHRCGGHVNWMLRRGRIDVITDGDSAV